MRAMRSFAIGLGSALAAAAAAALTLSPAIGQPVSALQGFDTGAPVDVAADRIEVQDRADRAIFSGDVVVRQGALRLNASRLTIAYSDTGGIEIERIEASGGVRLTSPTETARSRFAVYDLDERIITMVDGVTLERGESVLRGGRLVLDLDSGRAVLDGAATGAAAPGVDAPPSGRVTGRFTVPQRGGED